MQVFTYSLLFKIIFRFGNILVTILLLVYLIPIISYIDQNKLLLIPAAVSLIVIYMINKVYFVYYKILPYKIEADEEKIICSDFLFSTKIITIHYKDIEKISGGIFEGKSSGIMKVSDSTSKLQIGFSQKIGNSEKLVALILSKVPKELYNEVINNLTEIRRQRKSKKK